MTTKRVSFTKQENKVKQDHHECIDKNFIWELKKIDTPYNPSSLNYINGKFIDMTIEEDKALIHQEHSYFSVLSSEYGKPQNFQEAWNHKYPEEREGCCTSTIK